MKKIIFTGGGTGGHIMPNIALIEKLQNKYDCKYIGSKNSMEEKIISPIIPFFGITTCKLKRSLSASNLLIPFRLLKGICEAKKILKKEKPNLVFSKGGFVSVPVVLACHALKIPVVAHESDLSIGLANKITQKYAKVVCTSFEETSKKIKNGVYTGSPIRKEIFCGNAKKIRNQFYLNPALPTVLVVGGSLGSKTINEIIFENAKWLCKSFNILHLTGNANSNQNGNLNNNITSKSTGNSNNNISGNQNNLTCKPTGNANSNISGNSNSEITGIQNNITGNLNSKTNNQNNNISCIQNYHAIKSTNEIGSFYATADAVITRGGSNVLFELLALKKPMIIVPLQKGSRGDQVENAQNFSGQGIAKMIFETDLQKNPKLLETELNSLLKHKIEFIKNMDGKIYNGTDKIIKQIEKYIK